MHTSVTEVPGEVSLGSGQRDVVYPEVQLVQSLLIHAAFHWIQNKASTFPTEPSASPRTLQIPPLATANAQIHVWVPIPHRLKSHLAAAILFSETIATVATSLETETSGSCSFSHVTFSWAQALKGPSAVLIFSFLSRKASPICSHHLLNNH